MNHPPVKLMELRQHGLVLFLAEVSTGRREEDFVFFFDMPGVKVDQGVKSSGKQLIYPMATST
ncbi:MAG: hypothetical protein HY885_01275 [Deltaproteobacteria bacterium]|nr:hypothetical protein [Deltaproteobacteria bacterium]